MKIQPEYLLSEYRARLREDVPNTNTADRYYFAVLRLMRENDLADIDEITPDLVEDALCETRGRNACSALRQGIDRLQKYNPDLQLIDAAEAKKIQHSKRNRSTRPAKELYLDDTIKKINYIRNNKLKLAYRLMLASGLRVSEVADLEPADITQNANGRLCVAVRHGKGDKCGTVTCMEDPYLEKKLPTYLSRLTDGARPFYSSAYMKKRAWELGLECHDFRRIAAQLYRREAMAQRDTDALEVPSTKQIDEATMEFLRHERFSTTKRYLYNRKLKVHLPEKKKEEQNENERTKK